MFAPTTKYEKISGAFALDKSNFCFYVVLLVALVWLCGSFAEKCGKANKSRRKCAGKKYFLSEDLTRAAELSGLNSLPCSLGRNTDKQQQMFGS